MLLYNQVDSILNWKLVHVGLKWLAQRYSWNHVLMVIFDTF